MRPANHRSGGRWLSAASAFARGDVRLARRSGSNRFIGGAPMKTAGAAVLPGTGRTAWDKRVELPLGDQILD
jgi:hypothetical protein